MFTKPCDANNLVTNRSELLIFIGAEIFTEQPINNA